jgi:hypothetical protein
MMAALITGATPPVSAAPFSLHRFAPKSGDKQLTAMGGQGPTTFVASYLR